MSDTSRLSIALAVIVLLVGGVQAWRQLHPAPQGNPTWAPPPDIDRSGWTLRWSWPGDRVDRIELDGVAEEGPDGASRPYDGMLTLWFAPGARGDWPVRDGRVVAVPHPELIGLLAGTGQLGFAFRGHPRRDVPVPWLKPLTQPELVDFDVQPDHTEGLVRNRSAVPMTVRVRAGYRDGVVWREDGGHAARTHLRIAAGGTAPFTLRYLPAEGAPAPPFVRPLFGPTGDAEFDRLHPVTGVAPPSSAPPSAPPSDATPLDPGAAPPG